MPLIEIRQLSKHTRMGLWRMDESPEILCNLFPFLKSLEIPYHNEGRQKEFLSIRVLLFLMTKNPKLRIDHASNGKPLLSGYQLSISHTRGYAVLVLSTTDNVAVDIEQRSDRVARIAHKFIRPDESYSSIEDMLLIWSAKETLYKLHSDDDLQYFEMQSKSIESRTLLVENLKQKKVVEINFELTDDYVLTYSCEPLPA